MRGAFRHSISLLLLFLAPAAGLAQDESTLGLTLGNLAGPQWQARGLELQLGVAGGASGRARFSADEVRLPGGAAAPEGLVLGGLVLDCPRLERDAAGWRCDEGTGQVAESPSGAQQLRWRGRYHGPGDWELVLEGLRVGGGSIRVDAQGGRQGWQVSLRAERLRPQALAATLPALGLPVDWQLAGSLGLQLRLAGRATGLRGLDADLALRGGAFAAPDGLHAGEDLALTGKLRAALVGPTWQGEAELNWDSGGFYADPVFLQVRDQPMQVQLAADLAAGGAGLELRRWRVRQPGLIDARGTASLGLAPVRLRAVAGTAEVADLGGLYGALVQPFLIGTPGDDLEIRGTGRLEASADGAGLQTLYLQLPRADLRDRQDRFGFTGVRGEVRWSREASAARPSRLHFDGARLYRIDVGAFDVAAEIVGDRLRLLRPLVVPTLQGRLRLDSLALGGLTRPGLHWRAAAAIEAVSLQVLTDSLQWPPFNGSLSGDLPDMSYRDKVFNAGGGLRLSAFGGRVEVFGLQARDPLGAVPVVEGAAELRGLDLEALTRTFSFGRIEGRLDGELGDLQLLAWQPNRFRLRLFTPPGDDSRRRISQRAVENLTELGSGVPAGLSTTFLKLFDDFSYRRIEVAVALDGNAAELSGVARPDGGYYLVQGAGLPRIDVIGRNRRVAWKDLLERLRRIQVDGAQIR